MDGVILLVDPLGPMAWIVNDAKEHGIKTLVAFPKYEMANDAENKRYESRLIAAKTQMYGNAEYIEIPNNAQQAVAVLSGYNIRAVINGSVKAARLTEEIAKLLNLPGNNPETSESRTNYNMIYDAVNKHGLRIMATGHVTSLTEIEEFFKNNKLSNAVLTPIYESGERRTKLCNSLDEALSIFNKIMIENKESKDKVKEIVIQEYIRGQECIVDTVNYDGVHKVCAVWIYSVSKLDGKGFSVDLCSTQPSLFPGLSDCIRYAMDVLDAISYDYGSASVEIITDEKGPVILDINRKTIGYKMRPDLFHKALGHHITDVLLLAYTNPEKFKNEWGPKENIKLLTSKAILSRAEGARRVAPFTVLTGFLPSVSEFFMNYELDGFVNIEKTVDFETTAGSVLLFHENHTVLARDLAMLSFLENNVPDLLFDKVEKHEAAGFVSDISDVGDEIKGKTVAILTDTGILEWQNGVYTNANTDKKYTAGIVAMGAEFVLEKRYKDVNMLYSMMKEGGIIWALQSSYAKMPYGAKGIESVFSVLGGKIEYPKSNRDRIVRVRVKHGLK